NDVTLNDLRERLKKIRNCEVDPDYNIEIAKFICQKMLVKESQEKEDLAFSINQIEAEQREKIKEIICYLFVDLFSSQSIPSVIFPEDNIDPAYVDLVVHEASHLLTSEKSHFSQSDLKKAIKFTLLVTNLNMTMSA
ncbi:6021_t:CDS:2, partial [Racocetra persica]